MAKLVDRGADVHTLILGQGIGARYPESHPDQAEVTELRIQLERAASILGVSPHQAELPDNRFDQLDLLDVIQIVEAVKQEVNPTLVFTHHAADLNVDHSITARAVLTACRPLPGNQVETILGFETLSSTEWSVPALGAAFTPNWFEDAQPGLERKLAAMAAYALELRDFPHPRSLRGIEIAAHRWGMTAGLTVAEPFVLLRHVPDRR
jgi:N-acetylglucosamine malate deacetylase 1